MYACFPVGLGYVPEEQEHCNDEFFTARNLEQKSKS